MDPLPTDMSIPISYSIDIERRTFMDDLDKLRHLLHHWKEHNKEHGETYRKWAEKIKAMGYEDLGEALECLFHKTEEMDNCFEKIAQLMNKLLN